MTQVHDEQTNAPESCGACWECVPDFPFMMLCPECGNKRCPHASDHTLECTGSNDPGQPGSVYGAVSTLPG